MGPIVKKIDQYLSTEGLSDETILILENLKKEIKPIEKEIVDSSYYQGFTDKERGKRPTWNHYSSKYYCYFKNIGFGKLS
jgi:hypothetical protein